MPTLMRGGVDTGCVGLNGRGYIAGLPMAGEPTRCTGTGDMRVDAADRERIDSTHALNSFVRSCMGIAASNQVSSLWMIMKLMGGKICFLEVVDCYARLGRVKQRRKID